MKKLLFTIASVLILCSAFCHSKKSEPQLFKYSFVKCISGDCQNGKGIAAFKATDDLNAPVFNSGASLTYEGNFTNGEMNGEGILYGVNQFFYYVGSFQHNYFFGNGTAFQNKKVLDKIVPDSTEYMQFYVWDDDGCFQMGRIQRDDLKYLASQTGSYNKKHKKFWGDPEVYNKNEWILEHVKALHASSTKVYTTEVEMGNNITHAVKDIYLAEGKYSEVFNTDMIGTLAQGYKKYFVCVNSRKFAKRYHEPFGVSYFYQLINDKNQVVSQQVKESVSNDDCCYFEILPDGKYTIQVAYDYHNVSSGGERLNALKLEFTLYSHDFIYRKFMKN